MFLEILLFLQKYKKFQKLCCLVLATWSWVNLVTCPQLRAYAKGIRDSLAGQCPSCEKDLEKFSKIWVFRFLAGYTQKLLRLPSRLPRGWIFSCEKHLDNFSKFCHKGFWRLALVTCLWLTLVAKITCFAHWGSFSGQVSKLFIFPSHLVTIHLLVRFSLFQNHRVQTHTLHILPHFVTNLLEKVWFLYHSQYISHILPKDFLSWVFFFFFLVIHVNMMLEFGYLLFWWDCGVGFVGYVLLHSVFGCTMCYL